MTQWSMLPPVPEARGLVDHCPHTSSRQSVLTYQMFEDSISDNSTK